MKAKPSTMKPCTACGRKLAKGAVQCPECGPRSTSRLDLAIAALLAVMMGGLLYIFSR